VGRRALVGAAAGLLALAACSGDDATDGGPVGTLAPNSVEGAVLTTDPGTAYTEVGGSASSTSPPARSARRATSSPIASS